MPPVAAAPLPRLAQEAAAAARLKHGKLQMAGRAEPAMTGASVPRLRPPPGGACG
jgi:hypothetical protein